MAFSRNNNSEKESVHVAVRIRPTNERESNSSIITSVNDKTVSLKNPEDKKKKTFTFDYLYDLDSTQDLVYGDLGKQVITHAYAGYNTCVFAYGQTGCFAAGTEIMQYDGTYKAVEDVKINDTLMGDDHTVRNVLQLFRGSQKMYAITSTTKGFDPYIVNEDHVLVLCYKPKLQFNELNWYVKWIDEYDYLCVNTFATFELANNFLLELSTNILYEMKVSEYLELERNRIDLFYLVTSTEMELDTKPVPTEPYVFGYWLGQTMGRVFGEYNTSLKRSLSLANNLGTITGDDNIHGTANAAAANVAAATTNPNTLNVTDLNNANELPTIAELANLSLTEYKYNDLHTRKRFLSGVIDSYGYDASDDEMHKYMIPIPHSALMDDLLYIIKSIGLVAYVTSSHYLPNLYICISHDELNTFVPRVTYIGINDYYGFMLDGNHRFIGAGFNILRNSGKSHTMMGSNDNLGLIPRICKGLFEQRNMANEAKLQSGSNGSNGTNVTTNYKIELSYLEIYSEVVRDLLVKTPTSLKVREHPQLGPYVESLSQVLIEDYDTIKKLIDQGNKERIVASTLMNHRSSRSHAILTIYFTQIIDDPSIGKPREVVSKINLVDLAGSERIDLSGVTGINCKEAIDINKSLSALGLVINTLAAQSIKRAKAAETQEQSSKNKLTKAVSTVVKTNTVLKNIKQPSYAQATQSISSKSTSKVGKVTPSVPATAITKQKKSTLKSAIANLKSDVGLKSDNSLKSDVGLKSDTNTSSLVPNLNSTIEHVPFRDSVLTWILKESLGGNSLTYMIATISPSSMNYSETLNTLRYAANTKQIVNSVKVNEDPNDKLIRVLKDEIDALRAQLKNKSQNLTLTAADQMYLSDEITQREELMREKDKTWEQKLTESKRISDEVQERLKAELALVVDKHTQELKEMEKQKELVEEQAKAYQEEMQRKEEEMQRKEEEMQQKEEELKLSMRLKQKEFESEQIFGSAAKLQDHYEKRYKEFQQETQDRLQSEYEAKLQDKIKEQVDKLNDQIEFLKKQSDTIATLHLDEIAGLKSEIVRLNAENVKLTSNLQTYNKQLTNERALHSKQIQALHLQLKANKPTD